MTQIREVQRYHPEPPREHVAGKLLETTDFPRTDPWSAHMRAVLGERAQAFSGRLLIEGGIGDARNEDEIVRVLDGQGLPRPSHVIGIDIETWRLDYAGANLDQIGVSHELWYAGAYQWLAQLPASQLLSGNAIFCLPQAPLLTGESVTDGYDPAYIPEYAHPWDIYGLGLNFAVLNELAQRAEPDFNAYVMLNARVPEEILDRMVHEAGWRISAKHPTLEPVQQDPDTNISYTIEYDDGRRFYERTSEGTYVHISAEEAEARRKQSITDGTGRATLNVYHYLIIYELHPLEITN